MQPKLGKAKPEVAWASWELSSFGRGNLLKLVKSHQFAIGEGRVQSTLNLTHAGYFSSSRHSSLERKQGRETLNLGEEGK